MQTFLDYQARPDLLANKVILVTGAGDGIGRIAAKSCAAHGATVVLLGRTVKKLTSLYSVLFLPTVNLPPLFGKSIVAISPAS